MIWTQRAKEKTATKALLYCRISSESQARKGDGLRSQETRCREYAASKGYEVTRVFYDRAISGKLVDRPGIKELLQFLRRNQPASDYVIVFDDISRLARDVRAYLDLRDAIFETGAEMDCPTVEFREDCYGQYFEGMQELNAELHRRHNAEQAKARMRARAMNGYWCFAAPFGYRYEKVAGPGNLLVRDEPIASILQEALEAFASGRLDTRVEVKRFLEDQPVYMERRKNGITYEDVIRLLTRSLYAGYIEFPNWEIPLRKGHHEGLVNLQTYERIQERIKEGARVPARADINADFPLRGFVTCGDCEKPLTACWSKSKTGKKHPYYMCFNKGCDSYRKSIRRDKVEGAFEAILKGMQPSGRLFDYVRVIFKGEWDKRLAQLKDMKKAIRRDILKIDKQVEGLMDRIVDAETSSAVTAYERRIAKLEKEKLLKEEKLSTSAKPQRGFDEMFELAIAFIANPWNLWASDRLEDKRTVLKLAFEKRLPYSRGEGFRTPQVTEPFTFLGLSGPDQGMAERESAI